jgi:hypothetical protein
MTRNNIGNVAHCEKILQTLNKDSGMNFIDIVDCRLDLDDYSNINHKQ